MEVNELALKSKLRSARRLIPLAAALLLAALLAIPASNLALAQSPPGNEIALVNADPSSTGRSQTSSTPSATPTPATG